MKALWNNMLIPATAVAVALVHTITVLHGDLQGAYHSGPSDGEFAVSGGCDKGV